MFSAWVGSLAIGNNGALRAALTKMNIGLLWHSVGSGNLGVVALTLSQLALVGEATRQAQVSPAITIFGWRPDSANAATLPGVRFMPINARALLPGSQFRQALAACDLVLDVGEGDSFSDIYGFKRLAYLLVTKVLAARRAVLILSPQTLGPFRSRVADWLARRTLDKASMVFARDQLSYDWLVARGSSTRFVQAIDMAFKLPFAPPVRETGPGPVRLGINVSGLLFGGGYGGDNSLGLRTDYAALTRRLITWARQQQMEVWLVPHVTSNSLAEEDDLAAAQRLATEFEGLNLAGPFASPVDAKSFMASLDFFIGGRMHACIGALSAGVPTVPLAYSRKFNGLFGSLGYRWFVDCRVQETDEAFAFVCDAFSRRDELVLEVQSANVLAKQKLQPYQACLAQAFEARRSKP